MQGNAENKGRGSRKGSTRSMAGILQCTCLFAVRVVPFMVPLYPRPRVLITKIQAMAGILQCTCLACSPDVTFSGAPLPTPMRPKHKDFKQLADILRCTCLFSVWLLPSLVPFYPHSCVPGSRDSAAGWYPPVHVSVFARMLPFWSSITDAHCEERGRTSWVGRVASWW